MCECQSSNHPDTTGAIIEVVLDPRPFFKFCTKTVCVDACIESEILALWTAGIFTRHSCCGHNQKDFAEVAVDNANDVPLAAMILRAFGDRDWRIFTQAVRFQR